MFFTLCIINKDNKDTWTFPYQFSGKHTELLSKTDDNTNADSVVKENTQNGKMLGLADQG